jgi:hypothetical protein
VVGLVADTRGAFWIDQDGLVMFLDVASGELWFVAMGQSEAGGIAIDATNVYWTAGGALNAIPRAQVAARGVASVPPTRLVSGFSRVGPVSAGAGAVVFVAVDADSPNGRLVHVPTSGDPPIVVAESALGVRSLASDGTVAYWTEFRAPGVDQPMSAPEGGLYRAPLTGGGAAERIVEFHTAPGEIRAVGHYLYFHEGDLNRLVGGMFGGWRLVLVDSYAVHDQLVVWTTANTQGWILRSSFLLIS